MKMKLLLAVICFSVLGLLGAYAYVGVAGVSLPWLTPLAPTNLAMQTVNGDSLAPDAWTNQPEVRLTANLTAAHRITMIPEVEFIPAEQSFTGEPNLRGNPGSSRVTAQLIVPGRRYHWQIRARAERGSAGPWSEYSGTIGYEPEAPPSPRLEPLPRDGYLASRNVVIDWESSSNRAGTAGFAYSIDRSAAGQPALKVDVTGQAATISVPNDGDWFFHLRALDRAGNWSSVATLPIHVDTTPITFAEVKLSAPSFNPYVEQERLTAKLNKLARVGVSILTAGSNQPIRTVDLGVTQGQLSFTWDGKDGQGKPVPPGNYRFKLTAEDRAGSQGTAVSDEVTITDKRILVSLSQQRLFAYQGDKLVLQTLVTTGGPELPTPTGTFHILAKYSPFTFRSPWPKGSPYWYEDSPTSFAMLFDTAGYFIHDAPWRSWFGPGSNARAGTPGGNGTGTHGCVNVPYSAEASLFSWTPMGTPVIVQS